MQDALDVIVREGNRLITALRLASWSPVEREIAAVLRFHGRRGRPARLSLVGIIGGSSSGKSTVFNNLLGGRHASQVTMLSHTTKGLILAVPDTAEERVDLWLDPERILLPGLEHRRAEPDDRTPGTPDSVTVIPVHQPALRDVLLFDTPDYTTETSRREGDLTRRLLPWFDRVLVLVDEERWFDEQTFGGLRDELNRLRVDRMLVFNCNEGNASLSADDRRKLADQADRMNARHVLVEHCHGRGFRKLPDGALQPCLDWLTAAGHGSDAAPRHRRLARLLSDQAGHVLNENAGRVAQLEKLKQCLVQTVHDEVPGSRTITREVILTAEQRKLLSVYWRSIGRTLDWLRGAQDGVAGWLSLRGPRNARAAGRADGEQDRGVCFFVHEANRLRDRLVNLALGSRFWHLAGSPDESLPIDIDDADVEAQARQHAAACDTALTQLEERVRHEAADLKVDVAGIGLGALIGVMVGGVLAVPTGGLSVPAGAALGALIAAPATGLSARVCARLYSAVRGTPESRALAAAVDAYRSALREQAERVAGRILIVARGRTLDAEPGLRDALESLREWDGEIDDGQPSRSGVGAGGGVPS